MVATSIPRPAMNLSESSAEPPAPEARLLKALVAAARYSDGPTLFSIFQVDETGKCEVREQLPNGECAVWPEQFLGRCQAEGAIYQQIPRS